MEVRISPALRSAYDEQYSDELTSWRELGAKYKAQNILAVCRGQRFDKVLECGAGEGSVLKFLDEAKAFGELSAIEISDSGIAQIIKRHLPRLREVRKFDGYEIPYPDRHFDMVYCSHVLEHVEHPRLLLRELKRVARFQVLEVPLDYSPTVDEHVRDLLSYGHINVYSPALFRFVLRSEGFEIVAEKLSRDAPEVLRCARLRNTGMPMGIKGEIKLRLAPLLDAARRVKRARALCDEHGFSAYTCLARDVGELKVLGGP